MALTHILKLDNLPYGFTENTLDQRTADQRLYYTPVLIGEDRIVIVFLGKKDSSPETEGAHTITYKLKIFRDGIQVGATITGTATSYDSTYNKVVFDFDPTAYGAGCAEIKLYSEHPLDVPGTESHMEAVALIELLNDPGDTLQFTYTSADDIFDMHAEGETFYLRADALGWKPKYKAEITRHKDSAGNSHILAAQSEKRMEILLDEVPEFVHDALRVALLHDEFYINGTRYEAVDPSDYTPDWRDDLKLAQVKFEVTKYNSDAIRTNC